MFQTKRPKYKPKAFKVKAPKARKAKRATKAIRANKAMQKHY